MLERFRKKQEALELYEKYEAHMQHYNHNGERIVFNANGWTKLIHELLDAHIKEDFDLYPVKERFWAGEYEDGRRKVISLFSINDMFSTIKWGWNFAFIPRINGEKLSWARTDKSIYTHSFRLSEEFISGGGKEERRKSVFGRTDFKNPGSLIKLLKKLSVLISL